MVEPQPGGCEMAQTQAPDADQQAIALIQISGILNPNTTLDQIMELIGKISGLQDDAPEGSSRCPRLVNM
jgi:hypothetical protein